MSVKAAQEQSTTKLGILKMERPLPFSQSLPSHLDGTKQENEVFLK